MNAMIKEKHLVESVQGDIRINDYLIDVFHSLPSKKSIKKALKKGLIQVDGKRVSSALWVKSQLQICLMEEAVNSPSEYDVDLELAYEDDFIAIVNKPAGLVSSGNQFRTLQNALQPNLKPSNQKDAIPPRLVHRLDSATSGLIIVAKTANSAMILGDMLAEKKVAKTYQAIIMGEIENEGLIDSPIEGKDAQTKFKKKESIHSNTFGVLSWVELMPLTGRTHQLRIHMLENGSPILGDRIYGDPERNLKGKGLFLCSNKVEFQHPITLEKLLIAINSPKKFEKYWQGVKKRNASTS